MSEEDLLAARFEAERGQLRAVAYRLLGTLAEAEDAVQDAWLKLSRTDVGEVRNLGAWLTTVVSRGCLDQLRSRAARREEPLPEQDGSVRLPDPVVSGLATLDPEREVLVADSVGMALMVVLEALAPAERVAFVLHDMFDVPFDEIAPVVNRTSAATRQLASRARRRVQGVTLGADTDQARKREVVNAFLTASRGGDFEALLAVLDPEVVARSDGGALLPSLLRRGADDVASQAIAFARFAADARLVLVNGSPGVVSLADGRPLSVMSFTIREGRITGLDILTDPTRLAALGLVG
ncbi:sigma-70 family RNA polymerase sigma factor [Streptomyces noursei]|uniref:RNA polymerase sigma factor n=1 Tax=Streptomyces noursei TaxID=1971 RepID=A0A059WEY8_STRNR|nr:sigma-70 family RNA polymerase sigma factor [Streptomyces noursei]AKA07708.1 RNA polymerase sigma 70 [Streptomyces noursei ZPM]AIA07978.1 ECF subfamily RNA polymerase sigma factor [Streptomyces noursei]EOT05991.1 RNA polymerase sigma 70 [Streptomyces noursei CCRC 11814]EXU89796.1 RNA polymerase sigma 70 [Streptomyces noursei PD-1]MCZ0972048.1 sigma-70 family RNA polymerase sigma factor [Streptomyces noursei]